MNKIILVANTDWYLYNFRLSLAEALRQEGYEVVLASPPGPFTSQFAERGFRWLEWQVGRQTLAPWKELPALQELARIYRQEQPVLVHHHTIKPVLYGSLVVARLAASLAVVNSITGRGYVFEGKAARANLLRVLVKSLYRLALNRANSAAIFENEADRQYFIQQKFIPPERTWLIAILKNKIIDHYRRGTREAPLPDEPDDDVIDALFRDPWVGLRGLTSR